MKAKTILNKGILMLVLLLALRQVARAQGTALVLDGAQNASLPADLVDFTAPYTIEMWANPANFNYIGGYQRLFSGVSGTERLDVAVATDGRITYRRGLAGGSTTHAVALNRWHHLVFAFDGSQHIYYYNGIAGVFDAVRLLAQQYTDTGTVIGSSYWSGAFQTYFWGQMDEIRVWDHLRTQEEVQGGMYAELSGSEPGLVAYFKGEAEGNLLLDASGNQDALLRDAPDTVPSYAMVVPVPGPVTVEGTVAHLSWSSPQTGTSLRYFLTIDNNSNFASPLAGYNNLDCGNALGQTVFMPSVNTTYYYRVTAYEFADNGAWHHSTPSFTTQGNRTLMVNAAATGANNGQSWADAYTSLQPALDAAINGDQIWVAAGQYLPTKNELGQLNPTDPRTRKFHIDKALRIYGGFAGTEASPDQRTDFGPGQANETTLSGDILVAGDNTDNAYQVVWVEANAGEVLIDGFTLRDGRADGSIPQGAGLYHNGIGKTKTGELSLRRCHFTQNHGQSFGSTLLSTTNTSDFAPVFEDCSFEGNTGSDDGQSVLALVATANGSNLPTHSGTLSNCTFRGNQGLAMETQANEGATCSALVLNGLFSGNTGCAVKNSTTGAGTNASRWVNATLSGNAGGGIWGESTGTFEVQFQNCVIWNNRYLGQAGTLEANARGSLPSFSHCLVQGLGGGANGMLDGLAQAHCDNHPRFVAPLDLGATPAPSLAGDFRLKSNSPCLDAGDNALNSLPTDRGGLPRLQNGLIDLGAHEGAALAAGPPSLDLVASFDPFATSRGTASAPQGFTLGGSDLMGDITLAASPGFELSADGIAYAPELLLPACEQYASTTFYLRLFSYDAGTVSGNLSISSPQASDALFELSGEVANVRLTTIWDGESWVPVPPTANDNAVILGQYPGEAFDCANLRVLGGGDMRVAPGQRVHATGGTP